MNIRPAKIYHFGLMSPNLRCLVPTTVFVRHRVDDLRMCGSHREAWKRWCDGVGGCFAGDTVGHLFRIQDTLNQHSYHSVLQRYSILSGLRLVGLSFVIQQDNDPTHLQAVSGLFDQKGEWCIRWPGLHNHPTSTQLRWFGMSWTRVKEKQPTSPTIFSSHSTALIARYCFRNQNA